MYCFILCVVCVNARVCILCVVCCVLCVCIYVCVAALKGVKCFCLTSFVVLPVPNSKACLFPPVGSRC